MRICIPHLLLIIFLAFTSELVAQGNSSFCSNTALVPVFKQDFGVGTSSTVTTTAPAGSTNYNFGGVGSDGNYIVTPLIENANKSDWTKGGDHTGNPNGNMFLVNAGGNRSIFLQQDVSGLCPGSSYSFTAWLANVNTWSTKNVCGAGLVYPKITFNIKDLSNNLLATYTTDTLPLSPENGPAKWIKYGFQFSLPGNITSLRLEIVDFRGGGAACGNDVALDDILFEACVPKISVSLNGNSDVCVGDSGKLETTLTNSPYTNPAYLWQKSKDGGTTWDDLTLTPNDSSLYVFNNVVPANSGLYRVLVAPTAANIFNAYCSAISNTVYYAVNNLPILQPSTNAPICSGNTLTLNANASGGSGTYSNYQWIGPTNFSSTASSASRTNMKTTDSGNYQITVTDSKGCKANASLYIFVDSTPVLNTINVTDTICSGSLATASFKSSITTSAFYWTATIVTGSVTGVGPSTNTEYTGVRSATLTNASNSTATIKYSVHAKNNNCTSNTIDTTITIMPLNSTANAGNDTTICNPQPISLNAIIPQVGIGEWTQINGPSTIQFSDIKNAKATIQNLQPGTYSLVWSIKSYCGTSSDTLIINYIPKPITAFTISDTLVCESTTVQFNNTTPNIGAYQYRWDFGNGNYSTIAQPNPILFAPSITGADTTYTIVLSAYTSCDTNHFSQKIIVRKKPKASLQIGTYGNCFPILLNLTAGNRFAHEKYLIHYGDGKIDSTITATNFSYTYLGDSTQTYYPKLIVSNSCGMDSATATLSANQKPILQFISVPDSVCTGSTAQIKINSSLSTVKYYWGSKQLVASDSTSNTYTTINNGLQSIAIRDSVFAISTAGCKSITLDTSFQIIPNATKAKTNNDTVICSSNTVTFNGNIPSVGIGKWQQINGATSTATTTNNQLQVSTLTPGIYQFEWKISNYCSSTTDTVAIQFIPKPSPSFEVSDTTVCGATTIEIQQTTPNQNFYKYVWNFGNGATSTTINPSPVTFLPALGNTDTSYTISLIAYTNCDSMKVEKKIVVKKKPIANLSITALNTCLPLQVKFNPTIAGANTTASIFWGDGKDSTLSNDSSFTHTYFGNSNTLVNPYLVAQNSCGTDTAFEFINAIANNLSINTNLVDTAVCGIPFQLLIQNNTTGANSLYWNWGDGNSVINNSKTLTHNYTKPGIYTITHTISDICGDTIITKKIKINTNPKATINTLPNNSCIGDTIQLNTIADSLLQYKWLLNNQLIDSIASTKYIFSTPGNYNPLLQVTNTANGFSCIDTTSANITIIAEKPGTASITPTNGFCVPFTLQLITKSLPAASVVWYMGNDSTTMGDTASYTYTKGGDYLVKMKAISKGGCSYTDSTMVSIRSPQGKITIPNNKLCGPNGSINFIPTVKFTDRIAWNFGDGNELETPVQNQSHQYSKPGVYYPSAILISNTGCRIPILLDSIIIENVHGSFNTKTIYECGKTIFNFIDSSYSSSNISQLIWYTDNRFVGNGNSATSSFTITGTHTTQLIAIGKYGCTDTVAGTYNVNIYNLPKVNINAINEACLNSLMELKSEISSIDSVILRLWNLGNGKIGTDSAVRILYYDEGKYTVRLTVATINKCYDSALKQITIHPVPEVKVAGPEKICVGETVELKAAGANNFVWKDQQDNIICNNCLTIKVKPLRSTQYSVIGYNEFGCTQVNSTKINVVDKPKINIIPEDTICIGESTRLWVSGAANYQWLPAAGLNNYSSATPIATPSTTTAYKVVGRDMNNCFTDTATVRVVVGNPTPITVGRDSNFVAGSKIQLRATATSADIIRWKWSGGSDLSCVSCPNPIARVVFDECISCAATNRYGCTTNDTVCFKTFCPTTEVFIPNAFTPDGDGINDQFFVQAKGVRTIKSLRVFNRWGEVVFEKINFLPNDAASGWNGKIRGVTANPDVYVYICEVICEKGGTQLYKGNVAIIK
jgi:large repetitive protein